MRMVFYLLDLNYDEIQKEEFFESKNIKMIKVKGDPCNNEVKEVCYTFTFSLKVSKYNSPFLILSC